MTPACWTCEEPMEDLGYADALTSREELEEERRHCAALREQVRVLEDERDRLRNELGEVCEERDALRRGVRAIGQTVLKDRRRIAFDDSGGSDAS